MPRENQMTINDDDELYSCILCDERQFSSEQGLLQHCRTAKTHRNEWCNRCEWLFVSAAALEQHLKQSSNHWVCRFCTQDLSTKSSLDAHLEIVHKYCVDCEARVDDYNQHRIASHRRCSKCEMEFGSENNLIMHSQVHLPLSIECYGCDRRFAQHSAVLIHLESNTCPCNATVNDVDHWAFQCYQNRHYTNDWDDDLRYRCPKCGTKFKHVSGLLQHVESPACEAGYEGSVLKLKNYIIKRVVSQENSTVSNSS